MIALGGAAEYRGRSPQTDAAGVPWSNIIAVLDDAAAEVPPESAATSTERPQSDVGVPRPGSDMLRGSRVDAAGVVTVVVLRVLLEVNLNIWKPTNPPFKFMSYPTIVWI